MMLINSDNGTFNAEVVNFDILIGHRIIDVQGLQNHSDSVVIRTDWDKFLMAHDQNCCESVYLVDFFGDCRDLIDQTVLAAETRSGSTVICSSEWSWTFYVIQTETGSVNLRWCGESNGQYSMDVGFYRIAGGN